jgi:Zn-dependent oligopeptidase
MTSKGAPTSADRRRLAEIGLEIAELGRPFREHLEENHPAFAALPLAELLAWMETSEYRRMRDKFEEESKRSV